MPGENKNSFWANFQRNYRREKKNIVVSIFIRTWLISSKYAEKKLKDFHSYYGARVDS